ncbi:MAG: GGDEF domain-containing protein [Sneathiella sp.]|nr:GGDEF domain-containing protein [Sneathiella sp.]
MILAITIILYSVSSSATFFLNDFPEFLPVGLVAVGILLGWQFGQSNIALILCGLVLSYLGLKEFAVFSDKNLTWQVAHAGISILLPLNMLIFTFLEERGLFSSWGLLRLALVFGQAGGLYWITLYGGESVHVAIIDALHSRLLPADLDAWTRLPQPSLIFYFVGVLALILTLILSRSSIAGATLGALIASAIALHFAQNIIAVDLFMTAAILILTSMILQSAYSMAFVDELTEIPGRRALSMDMKKLRSPYVIAMADIDHFKKFNDTYGHDTGDQVLRMVAAHLAKIGGGGKAYRYGGEEFTILLPRANNKTAKKHLEEIRKRVEQAAFHIRGKERPKKKPKSKSSKLKGKTVKVTVSIGSAQSKGGKQKPDTILKAADKALYRAKKAGRNQVSR